VSDLKPSEIVSALDRYIIGQGRAKRMVAIALRWGLDPNDLKLVTAFFVFAALVLPRYGKDLSRKLLGGRRYA